MAQRRRRRRGRPTHEVTTISEFVAAIEELAPNRDDFIFRGQSQDWPLLPKIARPTLRLRMDLRDAEQSLLREFKLSARSFVDVLPQTPWEWLSVAQHYGMATRLLDWTSNPLAALWFAVQKPPEEGHYGVVWAFDPDEADRVTPESSSSPFSGERTRVFQPQHIMRRIIAQSGWFTVHKYNWKKKKGFIPLERQTRYKPALTKIVVEPAHFATLRYGLAQCGVNAASMLTDLTGICSYIEWRHSLLEDESNTGKSSSVLQPTALKGRRSGRRRPNA